MSIFFQRLREFLEFLNYDSYSYSYNKTHKSSLEMMLFGAVVAKCFFFHQRFSV